MVLLKGGLSMIWVFVLILMITIEAPGWLFWVWFFILLFKILFE